MPGVKIDSCEWGTPEYAPHTVNVSDGTNSEVYFYVTRTSHRRQRRSGSVR